jgi:hypothetical protein
MRVVLLVLLVLFWIGPSILVARYAERKGRSFTLYLVASLLVSWPITLVAAAVIRPRQELHH